MPTDTKIDDVTDFKIGLPAFEEVRQAYERWWSELPSKGNPHGVTMGNGQLAFFAGVMWALPHARLSVLPALPQPTGEDAALVARLRFWAELHPKAVEVAVNQERSVRKLQDTLHQAHTRLAALSAELEGALALLDRAIARASHVEFYAHEDRESTIYVESEELAEIKRARAALGDRQPAEKEVS